MGKLIELDGQKFGKWTVIKRNGSKNGAAAWLCLCDCGNKGIVTGRQLRTSRSSQCISCGNKQKSKTLTKSKINGSFRKQLLQNARNRGIDYILNDSQLLELLEKQNNKCALTGLPIFIEESYKKFESHRKEMKNHASLDRIDPSLHYTIDNVQWVHKNINRMKQNFSQEDFIYFCNMVAKENPVE